MSRRADGRRAYTDVTTLIVERLGPASWPAWWRPRVGVGSYATDRVDDGAPPRTDASPAEILETRILLEPRVARLAAERWSRRSLAGAAGNAVLARIAGPMWELMAETLRRRRKERSWDAEHTARVAAEHREILDAIAARDRDLADFLMEAHLRRVVGELFG
jgi:DNA-binding FadR family transcriptional regulator